MKKAFLTFFAVSFAFLSFAQPPQYLNYQASVRDGEGNIVAGQNVSFKIEILSGSASGAIAYRETHAVTTNDQGLVDLRIFGGVVDGSWSAIDWSADDYFLKVSLDIHGGTSYVEMGTSQLLSVPYAFHAATVATEKQQLSVVGKELSISEGNTVNLPAEEQQLSVNDEQLSISGGNTVDLPSQYNHFQTLSTMAIGANGLKELTGTTGETGNSVTVLFPEGYNDINTRVLSLEIYRNIIVSSRYWYGCGYTAAGGTVGYCSYYFPGLMEVPKTNAIIVYYPDELRDKKFRLILMKIVTL
jgi:hypothetical protein